MLRIRFASFRIALCGLVCLVSTAQAANRFRIETQEALPGSTGNEVRLLMDLDQAILGFSVYFEFDATRVTVEDIAPGSDALAVNASWSENPDASWTGAVFVPKIDNSLGRAHCGVVFDFAPEDGSTLTLAAGTGKAVLEITYSVKATASPGTIALDLKNVTNVQPVRKNVMTNIDGNTINPSLTDGSITVPDLTPMIESYTGNSGPSGTEFFILGQNFDQAPLSVKVCSKTAVFSLLADDVTLRVTAPDCSPGPATVEVCNAYGCDSDPSGFTYPEAPGRPEIDSFVDNSGVAGEDFLIVGLNFDQPGLRVSVCQQTAAHVLLNAQTIRATAPSCGAGGWAVVDVCTDLGCDSAVQGFNYTAAAPVINLLVPDEGKPGDSVIVSGLYFAQSGLSVELCGLPATFSLLDDSALNMTVPSCGASGPVDLKICTALGCTTLPGAFTVEATSTSFKRGDSNASGIVDLSDGIFTLNYLFTGGATPGCMDAADADDSGGSAPDLTDAVFTFRFLFLGGEAPPPPGHLACGPDPTTIGDTLDCAVYPPASCR